MDQKLFVLGKALIDWPEVRLIVMLLVVQSVVHCFQISHGLFFRGSGYQLFGGLVEHRRESHTVHTKAPEDSDEVQTPVKVFLNVIKSFLIVFKPLSLAAAGKQVKKHVA